MTTIFLFYLIIGFISEYFGYSWLLFSILSAITLHASLYLYCRTNATINSEQSLGEMIALIRIRSAEIGAIYHSIRTYQREARSDSWIPLFIAKYRSESNSSIYEERCDKREKKYHNRAQALYKRRFRYNPFFGVLNEPELMDIGVAMLCWTSNFDSTIRLLNSIRCDAKLSQHVSSLLREYRLIRILTLNGNYHILFKNWRPLSSLVRERYRMLLYYWNEVLLSHQCLILTNQASSHLNPTPLVLDEIWIENKLLSEMERNIDRALSQENTQSHGWQWDSKNEVIFFQNLKSNPIWLKLYGFEPFTFPEDEQTIKTKE